jgi:hypothetical protein
MADAARHEAERSHETAEIDAPRILRLAAALVAVVAAAGLSAFGLLAFLGSGSELRPMSATEAPQSAMPEPRLQIAPAQDLREFREQKHAMLSGYRWLDQSQGRVQLPIDRAMQLTAARAQTPQQAAKSVRKAGQ